MYGGKMRKGIAEACKTGWIYILDRTNGKPLVGIDERPVEQEPRNATAATQPFPRGDAVIPQCPQPLEGWVLKCIFGAPWDTPTLMSPGGNGGINWAPMAYSPRTNFFYVTAADRLAARIAPGSGRVAPPAFGAKYGGTLTVILANIAAGKQAHQIVAGVRAALVATPAASARGISAGHCYAKSRRLRPPSQS